MEKEEYMTVKEAADYLKLSVGYLYKLMMWKKVPYYKPFGNRCYFKPRELAALMGANKSYTADELQAQALAYALKKNN